MFIKFLIVTIFIQMVFVNITMAGGGFVGLGAGIAPDYDGSDDYEAIPVFTGRYAWDEGFFIEFVGAEDQGQSAVLRANLIPHDKNSNVIWSMGPVLEYRRGRDSVENNAVDRMRDIDDAIELGAFVRLNIDKWYVGASAVQDISDEHDGIVAGFWGGHTWRINPKTTLAATVSISYADDDFMETYFGVNANDSARSGLDTFKADSGFNSPKLLLGITNSSWDPWGITGYASYSRMIGDAADSPVVDDAGNENQFSAGIVATYRFNF